jgi:hypothetical protein
LPRVEAVRSPFARIRANPWLAVGIAVAALLVAAWLAWAIYVGSDRGVNEGLGVLIAWPAMVAALALISLPFIGIYLLLRRRGSDGDGDAAETEERPAAEEASEDEDEESEDEESEDSEPEPETAAS